MRCLSVRFLPEVGQIFVRFLVQKWSDVSQIFRIFGQILKLATLVMKKEGDRSVQVVWKVCQDCWSFGWV